MTAAPTCSRSSSRARASRSIVGFVAALVAILIGGTVGVLSGFFGGKTDTVLMRVTDYVLVIPDIPLMIIAAALFGRNLTNIIVIIGIIYWTSTARLIRAQVKSVRERVYVKRARALGAGNGRLVFRHVLPQVAPLLIANTVLMVALAIFAETYITFLGLGDPSTDLVGQADRERLQGRGDDQRRLVGDRPARRLRDDRDPRLHDGRAVGRGRPQPALARRASLRAPVPAAAARREAGGRMSDRSP